MLEIEANGYRNRRIEKQQRTEGDWKRDDRSHIIAQAETCPAVGLLETGLLREYGLSFTGVNEEPYGALPVQHLILTLSSFFLAHLLN